MNQALHFYLQDKVRRAKSTIDLTMRGASQITRVQELARLNQGISSSASHEIVHFPEVKSDKYQAKKKLEDLAKDLIAEELKRIDAARTDSDFDLSKTKSHFQMHFILPCRGHFPLAFQQAERGFYAIEAKIRHQTTKSPKPGI